MAPLLQEPTRAVRVAAIGESSRSMATALPLGARSGRYRAPCRLLAAAAIDMLENASSRSARCRKTGMSSSSDRATRRSARRSRPRKMVAMFSSIEKARPDLAGGNSKYTAGAMRFVYNTKDDLLPLLQDPERPKAAEHGFRQLHGSEVRRGPSRLQRRPTFERRAAGPHHPELRCRPLACLARGEVRADLLAAILPEGRQVHLLGRVDARRRA